MAIINLVFSFIFRVSFKEKRCKMICNALNPRLMPSLHFGASSSFVRSDSGSRSRATVVDVRSLLVAHTASGQRLLPCK